MGSSRGPRQGAGRRPVRVRRAQHVSEGRARDAARRGLVPLRRPLRRLVALDAGTVERHPPGSTSPRSSPMRAAMPTRAWRTRRRTRSRSSPRSSATSSRGTRAGGERAAELEARLERLRRLHAAFTEAADRAAIRADLESRLSGYRDVSWWSMGMSDLATIPTGRRAPRPSHPRPRRGSRGPRGLSAVARRRWRASAIVAAIEAPDYQATSMSSDGPDRRSIRVTHKNLSGLFFRAYRVDVDRRVTTRAEFNLLPNAEEVRDLVRAGAPAAEWETGLRADAGLRASRRLRHAADARDGRCTSSSCPSGRTSRRRTTA